MSWVRGTHPPHPPIPTTCMAIFNFLPFPPHPQGSSAPPSRPQTVVQKTKLVRNTCHVRKDTVAFKKEDKAGGKYQLSFRFDADVACKVAVYLVATESKNADGRLR